MKLPASCFPLPAATSSSRKSYRYRDKKPLTSETEANNDTDVCDDDDDVFVYANELADIGCGSGAFNTTEQHI